MKKILFLIMLLATLGIQAQTENKTIVITSDWHLSDSRSFESLYYYAWTDSNQVKIESFLDKLTDEIDQWDVLVLNGDIFEFWRSPTNMYMTADADGNVVNNVEYLGFIKQQNKRIFSKLETLHEAGKELVYMLGNHDLTVSKEDIEAAFPELFTCAYDTPGTGLYEPFGEGTAVAIEHGNRYEYFNAPYQHAELASTGASEASLLPPGFFTSKLGATATAVKSGLDKVARKVSAMIDPDAEETDSLNLAEVASFWNAIHAGVGSPFFTVKTRMDGIEENMKWKDYAVLQTNNPKLFKDSWTVENWKKRCELNKVPLYLPLSEGLLSSNFYNYLDEIGIAERLQNEQLPTLILVFGHSHAEDMITRHNDKKGDLIYMNEGAWTDDTKICTYGIIRYTAACRQYAVELHQINNDLEDVMIECRYLYVPENATAKLLEKDITGIENTEAQRVGKLRKVFSCGRIIIDSGGIKYNLTGQRLK